MANVDMVDLHARSASSLWEAYVDSWAVDGWAVENLGDMKGKTPLQILR